MSYHYVVTAHKPTNVTHAAVGNVTSPTDINLIISKSTRLEIHTVTHDGLQPVYDVPIYGRIATMKLWRPAGEQTDMLFLTTEKYQFCVLAFDSSSGEIVTRANGDLHDKVGRAAEFGHIAIIEPASRAIALRLYDGLLKVIPVGPAPGGGGGSALRDAFNLRLEELHVIDIAFLYGMPKPTIAVLYQDPKEARNVKTYELLLKEQDLADGPWSQNHVEGGASILAPVPQPFGGVLIIGEQTITYHSGSTFCSIPMRPTLVRAYERVDEDGRRWLLGDDRGELSILMLVSEPAAGGGSSSSSAPAAVVSSLVLQPLGVTSSPSAICYLDNGIIFVGSSYGDSQLIRLQPQDGGGGSAEGGGGGGGGLEVLEAMPNLGPIIDFCVVDLERQGQGQVVCCSGAFKDGSLRIMRNGIGIDEHASVELPGVKGLWALREASDAPHDCFLIVSFMEETRVLSLSGEELEESEIPGFEVGAKTLLCANMLGDLLLQVCAHRAALIDATARRAVGEWRPPAGRHISVAAADGEDVVLALSAPSELVLLRTGAHGFAEVCRSSLEHEASCLALSAPTHGRASAAASAAAAGGSTAAAAAAADSSSAMEVETAGARIVAVGLWTRMDVLLLELPSLVEVRAEPLGGEVMARSLLFATLERGEQLFCGMGDGHVLSFRFAAGAPGTAPMLAERKQVPLGTQPVQLTPFMCKGLRHVFAASDRPTVISSSAHKLLYANVNTGDTAHMCPFDSAAFPECLALAGETMLTIGNIDNIQKLHIKTVPLSEHPRRIAHDRRSRTFAVCTVQQASGGGGLAGGSAAHAADEGAEVNHVRLIDDSTFEIVDTHTLQELESTQSVLACTLRSAESGAAVECFVVGTAFILPDEPEPTAGRLLVLSVSDGQLQLLAEAPTKGAVYSLAELRGKVVAGVNNRIEVYCWEDAAPSGTALHGSLRTECVHHGHILALFVETRADFIVVGDLMKSVSLHVYKPEVGEIEDLARDYNSNWMTALQALDDDVYIGAESSYNLFTVRKNADATTDEERQRLEVSGEFHLGEHVNRFRRGSLTMQLSESDAAPMPTLLFGTVNGVIGVIAQLPEEVYTFLAKLQAVLCKVIHGVGGLKHSTWRAFQNERKMADASNFIDGDLIEAFLDLKRPKQDEICVQMDIEHEELCRRVEELTRLH